MIPDKIIEKYVSIISKIPAFKIKNEKSMKYTDLFYEAFPHREYSVIDINVFITDKRSLPDE